MIIFLLVFIRVYLKDISLYVDSTNGFDTQNRNCTNREQPCKTLKYSFEKAEGINGDITLFALTDTSPYIIDSPICLEKVDIYTFTMQPITQETKPKILLSGDFYKDSKCVIGVGNFLGERRRFLNPKVLTDYVPKTRIIGFEITQNLDEKVLYDVDNFLYFESIESVHIHGIIASPVSKLEVFFGKTETLKEVIFENSIFAYPLGKQIYVFDHDVSELLSVTVRNIEVNRYGIYVFLGNIMKDCVFENLEIITFRTHQSGVKPFHVYVQNCIFRNIRPSNETFPRISLFTINNKFSNVHFESCLFQMDTHHPLNVISVISTQNVYVEDCSFTRICGCPLYLENGAESAYGNSYNIFVTNSKFYENLQTPSTNVYFYKSVSGIYAFSFTEQESIKLSIENTQFSNNTGTVFYFANYVDVLIYKSTISNNEMVLDSEVEDYRQLALFCEGVKKSDVTDPLRLPSISINATQFLKNECTHPRGIPNCVSQKSATFYCMSYERSHDGVCDLLGPDGNDVCIEFYKINTLISELIVLCIAGGIFILVVTLLIVYGIITCCIDCFHKGKEIGSINSDRFECQALMEPEPIINEEIERLQKKTKILGCIPVKNAEESSALNALKRVALYSSLSKLPALIITTLIELIPAFCIAFAPDVMQKVPLLVSFFPITSAVAGNIGLQILSQMCAWLALPESKEKENIISMIVKLLVMTFYISTIMTLFICCLVFIIEAIRVEIWYYSYKLPLIVGISSFTCFIISGIFGCFVPLIMERVFKLNPSDTSGPLETTFQDVVGYTLNIGMAWLVIRLQWFG